MGLTMDNYVNYQSQQDKQDKNFNKKYFYDELLQVDALPDYYGLGKILRTVKAIVPSHAHLDHGGCTLRYEVF